MGYSLVNHKFLEINILLLSKEFVFSIKHIISLYSWPDLKIFALQILRINFFYVFEKVSILTFRP